MPEQGASARAGRSSALRFAPGWLAHSRMLLTRPVQQVVRIALRWLRLPHAYRLAQRIIGRWSVSLSRILLWRGLGGYQPGSGAALQYDYRMRRRRPRLAPQPAARALPPFPSAAETEPEIAPASPWVGEEIAPTAQAGPVAPISVAPPPPLEPPGDWLLPLVLAGPISSLQGVPEPPRPQATSARLVLPGIAAQGLARWGAAEAPAVTRPPESPARITRRGRRPMARPAAMVGDVLSRHGVAAEPPLTPAWPQPPEEPGLAPQRLPQITGRLAAEAQPPGEPAPLATPAPQLPPMPGEAPAGRALPVARTAQPLPETPRPIPRPPQHRIAALSTEVLARHGVVAPTPALRRPSERPGRYAMIPRLPRRVMDRAMAQEHRMGVMQREILARHGVPPELPGVPATPATIWQPQAGVEPAMVYRATREPGPASQPSLSAAQPPVAEGRPQIGEEALTSAVRPEIAPAPREVSAQPPGPQRPEQTRLLPRLPHRVTGRPVAVSRFWQSEAQTPLPPHRLAALSYEVLSRHGVAAPVPAWQRPSERPERYALIHRLSRRMMGRIVGVETAAIPAHRLAAVAERPHDLLTRYGLAPEPAQPSISPAGAETVEGQTPARYPPRAVRRTPWLPHRVIDRLAAETIQRTLGAVVGQPATPPVMLSAAKHLPPETRDWSLGINLQSPISILQQETPSLRSELALSATKGQTLRFAQGDAEEAAPGEGEVREATVVRRALRRLRARPSPRTLAAGRPTPIIPEVLHRAAGWLAASADRMLSFLRDASPIPEPRPEAEAHAQRDWPALGLLRRLARPAMPGEPAALQVLRRMSPAQARPAPAALRGLASLPSLGPGEALPTAVRRPMEALLGRALSGVRLYTSPIAEALGAQAFTTGERIVFAPGRMDIRSSRGLALLGHELAHIGQALAFKQSPGAGPAVMDEEERAAQRQEEIIRHIAEHGWPEGPQMEVRRARRAPAPSAVGQVASAPLMVESARVDRATGLRFEQVSIQPGLAQQAMTIQRAIRGEAPPTVQRVEAAPPPAAPEQPPMPDLDALARQVYPILKALLRAERDRHQLYTR